MVECVAQGRQLWQRRRIVETMAVTGLGQLQFDNRFTLDLPADASELNRPREVHGAAYSRVTPIHSPDPRVVATSSEVGDALGLSTDDLSGALFTDVFTGNVTLEQMDPHAACYGGHQFGNWAGQLGDGRAITLGEVVNENGRHMLQLKGAGPTPYSRSGDGFAVLRSSVREFLCSEAMAHLGVPTTRALSLALTGSEVFRDMLYDGHPEYELGAVVCRAAPSFIRFGSFEIFAARQDLDMLQALADHTIQLHFPELGPPSPEVYIEWFRTIVGLTAEMIVHWQRVGFVHGVMNTDNMSIHGLTIDYGPYGWLDDFDPEWTPNTTDAAHRRYRYGNQPAIGQWNLSQLANAIYPLVGEVDPLQEALEEYVSTFNSTWPQMMTEKLGLPDFQPGADEDLIGELLGLLAAVETDMTVFYRSLAKMNITEAAEGSVESPFADAYYTSDLVPAQVAADTASWLDRYRNRIQAAGISDAKRRSAMDSVNPRYVLRNYLAQEAIDLAEQGDYSRIGQLLDVLRRPYDEQPEHETFAAKRPDWARTRVGCSQLSCSS